MATIECPVNFVNINENKVRLTAFSVFLLSSAYLFTWSWTIPVFLTFDFFLRAFNYGKYSLLNILSGWIIRKFSIRNKPIDQAPKLFAAQIGFILADCILIMYVFDLKTVSLYTDGIIVLFSFLESVFGFCAGCYGYSFLKKIKWLAS